MAARLPTRARLSISTSTGNTHRGRWKGIAALVATLALAGCATRGDLPGAGPGWRQHVDTINRLDHWQAAGKLALRTAERSESASLLWEQRDNETHLRLSGPVGLNTTTVHSDGRTLEVRDGSGKTQRLDVSTPDAMIRSTGWDLPLDALPYWLKGLPAPHMTTPFDMQLEDNRARAFTQGGWRVEYEEYRQFGDLTLPTRLLIANGSTRARVLIRDWVALGSGRADSGYFSPTDRPTDP